MDALKERLYKLCYAYVTKKEHILVKMIADAKESGNNETKSSMGDKYETGRAMVGLEIEKLSLQLHEVVKMKETLGKISPTISTSHIQIGSIVFTEGLNYFLSINAGTIKVDQLEFITVSCLSPIAKAMIGLQKGSIFAFNGRVNKIIDLQ